MGKGCSPVCEYLPAECTGVHEALGLIPSTGVVVHLESQHLGDAEGCSRVILDSLVKSKPAVAP